MSPCNYCYASQIGGLQPIQDSGLVLLMIQYQQCQDQIIGLSRTILRCVTCTTPRNHIMIHILLLETFPYSTTKHALNFKSDSAKDCMVYELSVWMFKKLLASMIQSK